MSKARPCKFCELPYVEPCDGQNWKCGNYPLAEERHQAKQRGEEQGLTLGQQAIKESGGIPG